MKLLQDRITNWGVALHPVTILALIIGINVFWIQTLSAFSSLFTQVSGGLPVIDLQNMSGVLTASEASKLIAGYNINARILYWSFFILDNIIPLLSFGVFSLLWVNILRRHDNTFVKKLRNSAFILLPLGVGLFDIIENLCFIVAISAPPSADAMGVLTVGLFFVQLKAICLFSTFMLTMVLVIFQAATWVRGLIQQRKLTTKQRQA